MPLKISSYYQIKKIIIPITGIILVVFVSIIAFHSKFKGQTLEFKVLSVERKKKANSWFSALFDSAMFPCVSLVFVFFIGEEEGRQQKHTRKQQHRENQINHLRMELRGIKKIRRVKLSPTVSSPSKTGNSEAVLLGNRLYICFSVGVGVGAWAWVGGRFVGAGLKACIGRHV